MDADGLPTLSKPPTRAQVEARKRAARERGDLLRDEVAKAERAYKDARARQEYWYHEAEQMRWLLSWVVFPDDG